MPELYANGLNDWLSAGAIAAGGWVLGQVVYRVGGRLMGRMARRTATGLDDALVEGLRAPVVVLITVLGVVAAFQRLTFSERAALWMDRVFHVAVALSVTWIAARALDALVREFLLSRERSGDGAGSARLLPSVRTALRVLVWGLGTVVALNNAGYDVGALLAGIGIGGLALALAAQETVANIFGGITIYADKPFEVGDRVRVDAYDGIVEQVGIRSTRIRSLEGPIVVIPNKKFTESIVENVTQEPARRVRHELGLVYETSPDRMQRALEVLREVVMANQQVLEEEHLVCFNAFKEYSLNILFIYYVRKGADIFETQSRVHLEVLRRFNDERLSFAYPTAVELAGEYKP